MYSICIQDWIQRITLESLECSLCVSMLTTWRTHVLYQYCMDLEPFQLCNFYELSMFSVPTGSCNHMLQLFILDYIKVRDNDFIHILEYFGILNSNLLKSLTWLQLGLIHWRVGNVVPVEPFDSAFGAGAMSVPAGPGGKPANNEGGQADQGCHLQMS